MSHELAIILSKKKKRERQPSAADGSELQTSLERGLHKLNEVHDASVLAANISDLARCAVCPSSSMPLVKGLGLDAILK